MTLFFVCVYPEQASSIGRKWLRTIDSKSIPRSELPKIIEFIEQESRTILLTDRPGSGKTCILLDLADYIEREQESVWGLLFIKGDLFTNVENEQDLVAKGLPEDIVGQCARLADHRRVIVIIDSLDVLSLSRQHDSLKVFLGILDRLEKLDGITFITACRNFDLEYDPLLRGRSWQHRVNLQPLDFENEVKPFLRDWGVDISKITPELQELLQIPQNLRIYEKLAKLGVSLQPSSAYELYNSFLEEVVVKNQKLGTETLVALQNMAEQLMQQRAQSYSKASFEASEEIFRLLISQEVLSENSPGVLAFSHQTLADCVTVRAALAKQKTLAQFILEYPQLPFIRPAVRAFFFYLRAAQPQNFRRQVWEVLSHSEIAYHVKLLTCESLAEISPVDEDWSLLRKIFHNDPDLFRRLFWKVDNRAWFNILTKYWLPQVQSAPERESWLLQFVRQLSVWMNVYPVEVIALWKTAIPIQWATTQKILEIISSVLTKLKYWKTEGVREILEALIDHLDSEDYFVGNSLGQWVRETNSGDDLLWRYITKNISLEKIERYDLDNNLRCMPYLFHENNFLESRLCQSDHLLDLVLNNLESWSATIATQYGINGLYEGFLHSTSWAIKHSQGDVHSCLSLNILLDGVEEALKYRARHNNTWWLENESRLRSSQELAIRYFVIEAYKENIRYSRSIKFWIGILNINCLAGTLFLSQFFNASIFGFESLLRDETLFQDDSLYHELCELMLMAYPKISESAREANQTIILALISERKKKAQKYNREYYFEAYSDLYDLCLSISSFFRNAKIQEFIENWRSHCVCTRPEPKIYLSDFTVEQFLSPQDLLKLSKKSSFRLLRYYETFPNIDRFDFDREIVGI
ncbi:NACHT domain-containing protein [Lusitaniella coriacea]|uniref:NACHT domain-containing protein n=1 Tax=Lusitaniella coriacea TaxID=1983105 RepID=UPI003CF45C05